MSYRTTPKMADRKEAHRARLLEAAIRLFGKRGYHATTVPMIVKASGSSTGAFYFYFRNKEDIFAAALERFGQRLAAALNQAIAKNGPEVAVQMQTAIEEAFVFLADNPDEARIFIVESSGLEPRLQEIRRAIIDSHARSVENALLAADLGASPGERKILARCWIGSVYESVHAWFEQPAAKRPDARSVAATVARFNLRGAGALAA